MPGASARTLDLLARSLEKLPLLPPAEMRRISVASRLLAPFQDCAAIAFEVWHEPEGARLRLCSQSADAGFEAEARELSSSEDAEIDESPSIR